MKIKYRLAVILSTTLLFSPVQALAEFVPGDVFVESCNNPAPDRQAACVGYVAGIVDSQMKTGQFCLPPNVTPKDITNFVREYGTKTISRHQPAVNIVMLALKAKWPCVNNGPRMVFGGQRTVLQFRFNGFNGF